MTPLDQPTLFPLPPPRLDLATRRRLRAALAGVGAGAQVEATLTVTIRTNDAGKHVDSHRIEVDPLTLRALIDGPDPAPPVPAGAGAPTLVAAS